MTVPEYEVRFGKLSKYAPDLVNTEAKRCHRFRKGLSSKVTTRLTTYEKEEYALLVEMAKRVENDYNDNRESYKKNKTEGAAFGKSGGGNSRGGGQKSQVTKTQDLGKSQGGSSGWWKGKAEQGPSRQTMSGATTMSRQCFSCGSTNHLKRDCPSALKSIKCYTCGEVGHMAAQCPRAPTPVASSVGSVQGGRGGGASGSTAPGRVFAITRQGAQASPGVVTGRTGEEGEEPGGKSAFRLVEVVDAEVGVVLADAVGGVGERIGHGEGEAVDEFGPRAAPGEAVADCVGDVGEESAEGWGGKVGGGGDLKFEIGRINGGEEEAIKLLVLVEKGI
ncbi:hypothetical protein RHGRI_010769 [Rhododendron griersonianum]|uniref:CCHC-type domain-containing protein n=1 Tax=Rhododendron griersonianum TaxID=479676 RepID=A0AAV6KJX1_9ERIC|nr:hypothetical protein RHGRI_010769 [Rhododendron griersonianum]